MATKTFKRETISARGVALYREFGPDDKALPGTIYVSSQRVFDGFPEEIAVEYEAGAAVENIAGAKSPKAAKNIDPKLLEAKEILAADRKARKEAKEARAKAKAEAKAAKDAAEAVAV